MDQAGLEVRDKPEILSLRWEAEQPVLLRFNLRPSRYPASSWPPRATRRQQRSSAHASAPLRDEDSRSAWSLSKRGPVKVAAAWKTKCSADRPGASRAAQTCRSPPSSIASTGDVNVSGGRLEEGTQRYLVRTVNQFRQRRRNARAARHHRRWRRRQLGGAGSRGGVGTHREFFAGSGRAAARHKRQRAKGRQVAPRAAARAPERRGHGRQGYKEREAIIRMGGNEASNSPSTRKATPTR